MMTQKLISDFADDPDYVELIEAFVAVMPQRIEEVRACAYDRKQLASKIHQLKGAVGSYGFSTVHSLIEGFEPILDQPMEDKKLLLALDELLAICACISNKE